MMRCEENSLPEHVLDFGDEGVEAGVRTAMRPRRGHDGTFLGTYVCADVLKEGRTHGRDGRTSERTAASSK